MGSFDGRRAARQQGSPRRMFGLHRSTLRSLERAVHGPSDRDAAAVERAEQKRERRRGRNLRNEGI